jgi:hypothetical protein
VGTPQKQMGDGTWKVRRDWRHVDPQTGETTRWAKGQPYTGPMNIVWLHDAIGPDGKGPLIYSNTPLVPVEEKPAPVSSNGSTKEK